MNNVLFVGFKGKNNTSSILVEQLSTEYLLLTYPQIEFTFTPFLHLLTQTPIFRADHITCLIISCIHT